MHRIRTFCLATLGLLVMACAGYAAEVVPHHQDRPPGPALSPAEAIARMTVPEGFHVELVASEPDLVNPVAMTFDERGRVWVTESLEYPRQDPGPGRDRVKVLEDTDGDGRADRFTIFADGFNIPSGIAVGHGGVWLANAPDILFLQDTDGDGRADKQEVVVTGFGRDDTHELPNSLTWGPDGWLYGLNGVFNPCTVEQGGKKHEFTCALFRIHPRTREFQLFAEGTSNPWGITWDPEGSAFVSACVIDHLWHLAESAYYIRQGGPYPQFVDPMRSIVRHTHQKAAYCGIHYFDSDAYPLEYRDRLYMGNIHGNCLNVDTLARKGSTYEGSGAPDFLSANDAWFMPVVQKTGPDGCLYVLDWYDRYHCYQDARRDPAGIDRLKGRLYRIRYRESPRATQFNLAAETTDQLIERLHSQNVYFRDIAQRLLTERNDAEVRGKLERLVADRGVPRKTRLHALWVLVGCGELPLEFHQALLAEEDAGLRAWGVRAAGNQPKLDASIAQRIVQLAHDPSADVRLQVATAAPKINGLDAVPVLLQVLERSADDPLIPHVVWQNLHPLLERQSEQFFLLAATDEFRQSAAVQKLLERATNRVLAGGDATAILGLVDYLDDDSPQHRATLAKCLNRLAERFENGELSMDQLTELRPRLAPITTRYLPDRSLGDDLHDASALLAASWRDAAAVTAVREMFASQSMPLDRRVQALRSLVAAGDETLEDTVKRLFADPADSRVELRRAAIAALGHTDAAWVPQVVLAHYQRLESELRPMAMELLCERRAWAEQLLDAVGRQELPQSALNANQVRQLLVGADSNFADKVGKLWGSVRNERDPGREQVIAQMRSFLRATSGDPQAGQEVFRRVCGQCHKLHGQGEEVGPDITLNGRNSFEQLLSNVFDPSLVIGAAYQARTVVTGDGRVITGLVAEDNPQRVVLKVQGGKLETIAREDVEMMKTSALSLMPEDLEKQLKPQELADLFALLTLDKPPGDPTARKLPGSQPLVPRDTSDPREASAMIGQIAPDFELAERTNPHVAIVAQHAGREGVLRTAPGCVLLRPTQLPRGKRTRLVMQVASEPDGAWQLVISVDGKRARTELIGGDSVAAWKTLSFDIGELAGDPSRAADRTVRLELTHERRGSARAAAYWSTIEIISQ